MVRPGGPRSVGGGIFGLVLDCLEDPAVHSALAADLIRAGRPGLRLSCFPSTDLDWVDLYHLCNNPLPGTSYYEVLASREPSITWGPVEELLAQTTDQLRWLVWAKTEDAQRRVPRNRPEPLPRPGDLENRPGKLGGGDSALPMDQAAGLLGIPSLV